MILFAALVSTMCAAACLMLLRPYLWPSRTIIKASDLERIRAEHAALEGPRASTEEAASEIKAARDALARRALDLVLAQAQADAPRPRDARGLSLLVLLFVPFLALPVYWKVGTPEALDAAFAGGAPASPEAAVAQMRERVAALEARLASAPEDGQGWAVLGRYHAALGEYRQAADAFARADPLVPNDAQLLADYADALAMAQERRLGGEPARLLLRALKVDPNNIKALLLAGTAAFEIGLFKQAVDTWERAEKLAPQDSELIASLRKSIEEAKSRIGETASPDAGAGQAKAGETAAVGMAFVSGRVSLAPDLASKAAPDDTVYVFARAATGPRMPLAAFKRQVRDLPFDFRLDDSMAMAPTMKLSSVTEVILTARVSKSGEPIPKSGDLEFVSPPVKLGAVGVQLSIRDVVK